MALWWWKMRNKFTGMSHVGKKNCKLSLEYCWGKPVSVGLCGCSSVSIKEIWLDFRYYQKQKVNLHQERICPHICHWSVERQETRDRVAQKPHQNQVDLTTLASLKPYHTNINSRFTVDFVCYSKVMFSNPVFVLTGEFPRATFLEVQRQMHWSLSSFKNICAYQKVLSRGALTQAFQYFINLEKNEPFTFAWRAPFSLHSCLVTLLAHFWPWPICTSLEHSPIANATHQVCRNDCIWGTQ